MKKLLIILSVITIDGTSIPAIIAASSYQKQEKIENIIKRQKRNNNENNKMNQTKIIIKTNGIIFSSGVVLNNKLYFGSQDKSVYEYDPIINQQKVVITTNGPVTSSGVVLNNKLYFGSYDHNVYEYDPATNTQKVVIKTNRNVYSSGVILNNKLYFGSWDHNVYEYDPATNTQKVVIKTEGEVWSSGVLLNNKLYIGSRDYNVYEYDPVTEQQKVVIKTNSFVLSSGVVLNNKVYFGSWDHNVYEYDPVTEQQKVVIKTNSFVLSSGVVLNDKIYIGSEDYNVYEYNPTTQQNKVVIKTNNEINSSGLAFENKVYFGSYDHNVYEYDPVTEQQKVVIKTNDKVQSFGIFLNHKLYFGSYDHNVYEYSKYYDLGQINDNSDNVILNELNYLIPELDILQLQIINKTNNSAIVKLKNNLNNNLNINIQYSIDNTQNKIVNLNKLIKKAIFFKFRDQNSILKLKEIDSIDTNNLNFGSIEIIKDNDLHWSVEFKNVCFDIKERRNDSSIIKSVIIPKCEYNQKANLIFQIITGIIKNKQNNVKNGWTLNIDDENKLNDFVNVNYRDKKIKHTLSNDFDFANLKQQNQEIEFILNEPEDEIEISPSEKVTFAYSVRENKYEATLNLKQKITGKIIVQIINDNNQVQTIVLSIKEAMQILQKYILLPDEITINEDNSITFNGKAIFSRISEGKPKLILNTSII